MKRKIDSIVFVRDFSVDAGVPLLAGCSVANGLYCVSLQNDHGLLRALTHRTSVGVESMINRRDIAERILPRFFI